MRRLLAAAALAALVALWPASAASAAEPDLWACLPEERAAMGVPAGEDCYLTGAQLDGAGWVEMDDAGEWWCAVDPGAPAWVRDVRDGPC